MMTLEEKQAVYERAVAVSKMPSPARYSHEVAVAEPLSSYAIEHHVKDRDIISNFVPVLVEVVKADLEGVGSIFNEVVPFGLDINYGVYHARLSSALPLLSFMGGSEPPPVLDPLKNEFPFVQQFDEYDASIVIGPRSSALLVSVEGLKIESDWLATIHLHPWLSRLGLIGGPVFMRGTDAVHDHVFIHMPVFNANPIASIRLHKQQGCFAVNFSVNGLTKPGGSED